MRRILLRLQRELRFHYEVYRVFGHGRPRSFWRALRLTLILHGITKAREFS